MPPDPSATKHDPLVGASLVATWLVWGSTYLVVRFALASFAPFFLMGSRFLVAGLLLVGYARWRGAAWPHAREWLSAVGIGVLLLGGGMGGTAFAELTVESGIVVAFVAVTPLLTTLARLPSGVRPKRAELVGISIGLLGVLLLARGHGFAGSTAGLVAMLIACSSWTAGSVLSLSRLKLAPGAMGYGSEMLAGGAFLLLLSLVSHETPIHGLGVGTLAAWAYLVVAGSLIGFTAYMYLLGHAPSALATSYTYVNPVIALLLGVTVGGETVTSPEWLAAAIILAGVILLFVGRHRAAS
jgi:drug/metabolite transporter (DMT)-like permease